MMDVKKLHVPVGEDLEVELLQHAMLHGRRHIMLDPQYVISDDWHRPIPLAVRTADVVVVDSWDECTRDEQSRVLVRLFEAVPPSALVLLRYMDHDAFTYDGVLPTSFQA
jgi:hypothetical protein